MSPRGVIFDFDGVIVESVEVKSRAFVALFPERPDLHAAILAHHQRHLGRSRYDKLRWIHRELFGEEPSEERVRELAQRFSELVFEATIGCPLVPGALETLAELRRLAVPAFVASGTPQEELAAIVERRGLAALFAGVWGSPAPKVEILRGIAARLAVAPGELVMVGDGLSDWQAAREAGVPFVLRETAAQRPLFAGLAVARVPDLVALPARLAALHAETPA